MVVLPDGYNLHLIPLHDVYIHEPSHKCPCGVEWKPRLDNEVGVVWNFWHTAMHLETGEMTI